MWAYADYLPELAYIPRTVCCTLQQQAEVTSKAGGNTPRLVKGYPWGSVDVVVADIPMVSSWLYSIENLPAVDPN